MFSGAGGLDMGFHNKGFKILWANDLNKDACDTYDKWANYDKNGKRKPEKECTEIECGDISKIEFNKIAPGEIIDVEFCGAPFALQRAAQKIIEEQGNDEPERAAHGAGQPRVGHEEEGDDPPHFAPEQMGQVEG